MIAFERGIVHFAEIIISGRNWPFKNFGKSGFFSKIGFFFKLSAPITLPTDQPWPELNLTPIA